jgi:predicted membrane protein
MIVKVSRRVIVLIFVSTFLNTTHNRRLDTLIRIIATAALCANVLAVAFLIHIPTNTPGTTCPHPMLT